MAKIKTLSKINHHTKPSHTNKRAFEKVYWPYIPIILAIGLLLSLGLNSGNLRAYIKHPGGRVLSYATSMSISGLLADSNSARQANSVGGLSLNEKLDAAAQAKADDMAARDYWSHYTPDGNPPWIFVTAQGYSYQKLGENLATGFNDEQSTIDGWMASPPHRENLLDPAFSDVGFGFANNPNYTAAGGGPMTIVVAFYGQPQVLSATTIAPSAPPATKTPHGLSLPVKPPVPVANPVDNSANKPQPATTSTPKSQITPQVKTARIQTAIPAHSASPLLASFFGAAGIGLFLLWANYHIRRLHRLVIKGERYAFRHPLTDIGIMVIAALLFILSQTAGIIQ